MTSFQLFDRVQLREAVALPEDREAPAGTPGTVVEVLRNEEKAYLVELFGDWVKRDVRGKLVPCDRNDPDAFRRTLGVETVSPHQLRLVQSASETV